MNNLLFGFGMVFLIMGLIGVLYMPTIVHGFYDLTGLNNLPIYQNEKVISDIIYGNWIASVLSALSGFGMIIGSKL